MLTWWRGSKRTKQASSSRFIRALILFMRVDPSWPNRLLKTLLLNTFALGITYQYEFWKDTNIETITDGIFIFNCLRNCYTIFYYGCTILHSHKQCTQSHSLHILTNTCYFFISFVVYFLIVAILMDLRGYLIAFFSPLVISDMEHLFRRLLITCTSSLEKCLFKPFAHFKIGLFVLFNC